MVTLTIENHIATLTLNNPEFLNAMDEKMAYAFDAKLKEIRKNKSVRVVILKGAGRAFSSGGNLQMIQGKLKKTKATNIREMKKFYKMFLQIRDLSVPVIASIHGHAVGAGFCLALGCDLRFAAKGIKMGANFARMGLAAGMGGTYLVTRLAGPTRAAEVLLTGDLFSAEHAYDMGLLNGVVEPQTLDEKVNQVAQRIASNGPIAVAWMKKGIQKALHSTLPALFEYDAKGQAQCFASTDMQEGVQAMIDKREPKFSGK